MVSLWWKQLTPPPAGLSLPHTSHAGGQGIPAQGPAEGQGWGWSGAQLSLEASAQRRLK